MDFAWAPEDLAFKDELEAFLTNTGMTEHPVDFDARAREIVMRRIGPMRVKKA